MKKVCGAAKKEQKFWMTRQQKNKTKQKSDKQQQLWQLRKKKDILHHLPRPPIRALTMQTWTKRHIWLT